MSRAQVAQRRPDPGLDLAGFPQRVLPAGRRLWRAARRERAPWWCCSCGGCRFDLPAPRGTCYLGADPLTGVLETLGADWVAGSVLTPDFLARRRLYALDLPGRTRLANLSSRAAVGFRVSNELATMTPYDVPQAWACAFDRARGARGGRVHAGIAYRARFDPGAVPQGIALFDEAGERPWTAAAVRELDADVQQQLAGFGVVVARPPLLDELEVAER